MGKCNLLKPLINNNGNFFIFSQYTEDLTKEYTQKDTYRVVPSKFIALNLDLSTLATYTNTSLNNYLPEVIQNYYENHCCYWRGNSEIDWTPELSLNLLLQTLEKYNMISIESTNDSKFYNNINYIGDINIYSNQDIDGMTYNEIYCYIPNNAKKTKYILNTNSNSPMSVVLSNEELEGKYKFIQGFELEGQNLDKDTYFNDLTLNPIYNDIDDNKGFLLNGNSYLLNFGNESIVVDSETPQFNINTIIVLYDIIDKTTSQNVIYSNIPMGIYFTGTINTDNEINNHIVKYVSNEEIYGQGTSYGLRICTRYLSQANINTLQENITVTTDNNQENITTLLSKINDSQILMQQALNKTVENTKNFKDFYALFKNTNTNVPYIENVCGVPYWFVNGKNTEVKVLDETKLNISVNSISTDELNNIIHNNLLYGYDPTSNNNVSTYLESDQLKIYSKSINDNFVQKSYVTDTYITKSEVQDNYLTKSEAQDNYLSIQSGDNYLTKSEAKTIKSINIFHAINPSVLTNCKSADLFNEIPTEIHMSFMINNYIKNYLPQVLETIFTLYKPLFNARKLFTDIDEYNNLSNDSFMKIFLQGLKLSNPNSFKTNCVPLLIQSIENDATITGLSFYINPVKNGDNNYIYQLSIKTNKINIINTLQ